jgi:hypothetical protein
MPQKRPKTKDTSPESPLKHPKNTQNSHKKNMITLQNDGKTLELAPDQSVQITISNPVFDPDRISRVFTLPFKLPITSRNSMAMQFRHRFDSSQRLSTTNAQLSINSNHLDSGEIKIIGSVPDAIEVAFQNNQVDLVDQLSNVNLWEIMDTITIPDTAPSALITLTVFTPPLEYIIGIDGNIYGLTAAETASMTTAQVAVALRDQINADYPGMASTSTGTVLHLDSAMIDAAPCDWSAMVNLEILSYYTVGRRVMRNFTNYVNSVRSTPSNKIVFPVVRWENFYGTDNPAYTKAVNKHIGTTVYENTPSLQQEWEVTYIPFVKVRYILERIALAIGVGYIKNENIPDFERLIVPNNYAFDAMYYNYYEDEQNKYLNGFGTAIDLNRHVPRITALEFIRRLVASLNLTCEYKDGGLVFRNVVDIQNESAYEASDYLEVNSVSTKINRQRSLEYRYQDNPREQYSVPLQQQPWSDGDDNVQQIILPFNTMYVRIGLIDDPAVEGLMRIPHTSQPGKSPLYNGTGSDLPFYLLFQRDTAQTSNSETYVYATYDDRAADGTTLLGNLSLEMEDLLAIQFEETIYYANANEVRLSLVMPVNDFLSFRNWKQGKVYAWHPLGRFTMAVKDMQADVRVMEESNYVRVEVSGVLV